MNFSFIERLEDHDPVDVTVILIIELICAEAIALFDEHHRGNGWVRPNARGSNANSRGMYAARAIAVNTDKRYTKSGLELKYYEEDEWNKLSNQQRNEIRKAK